MIFINEIVRLVAENEVGTSEASQSVTIITAEEAPSGPPTSIAVEPVDQHTLKLTWKVRAFAA